MCGRYLKYNREFKNTISKKEITVRMDRGVLVDKMKDVF